MQKQEEQPNRLMEKFRDLIHWITRRNAGLADTEVLATLDALSMATPRRMAEEYRRLQLSEDLVSAFSSEPLQAGDERLVGREEALETLKAGITGWRQDRPMLLAVVAPKGGGLTTLLRQVETLVDAEERCVFHTLTYRPDTEQEALALCAEWFELPSIPESIDNAIVQVIKSPTRVMVLDQGHYLYSRLMGRRKGILALGALMVATQERHMWILGCEEQAWRRQCHANHANRYYDEVIELPPFTRDETVKMICQRLASVGYTIKPEIDEPDADNSLLPETLARAVHRLSCGHPGSAYFQLLRSLRPGPDRNLAFEEPHALDYGVLKELSRTDMLTLAEISAHGTLTADEHRAIFRMSVQGSGIVLHNLRQMSLIRASNVIDEVPAYRLEALHASAINTHLIRANYLY